MAFQPCPGIASITMEYSQFDGEFAENVFHVGRGDLSAWTAGQLAVITEVFASWFDGGGSWAPLNNLSGFMQQNSQLLRVSGRGLDVEGGAEFVHVSGASGVNPDDPLPNGVTFAVTLRTGFAGRSFRGRWYVPNLTEAGATTEPDLNVIKFDIANDLVNTTEALAAQVTIADAGAALVVLSRFNKDAVPAPPHERATGIGTPVIGAGYHDLFMDYQRRRAPGHNRHH
jgi:hypothetical protein